MSEKVDLIWYEKPTFPATEERESANAKQSGDSRRQKSQEPVADRAEKSKLAKVTTSG